MIVSGTDQLLSILPQKGFGYSQDYGTAHFGYCLFANFNKWAGIYRRKWINTRTQIGYAVVNFGITRFGTDNPKNSVFTSAQVRGDPRVDKMVFYWPTNPRTDLQQANRGNFRDSMTSWNTLTTEQKQVYNVRARSRRMSGMNLYIKEYMQSV